MAKKAALFWLSLSFVWVPLPTSAGTPEKSIDALVSIVRLDEQGNPHRQGMGILINQTGSILTGASLLANCRSGIVKLSDGTLHAIRKITQLNRLQDVAVLQIELESQRTAPVGNSPLLNTTGEGLGGSPEKGWDLAHGGPTDRSLAFVASISAAKAEAGNYRG